MAGKGATPKGKPFVELAGQIMEVEGEVASISEQLEAVVGQVDSIEDRLDADEATLLDLTSQLSDLEAQLAATGNDIAALEAEIQVLQAENVAMQAAIAANTGDIAALQDAVDYNSALIAVLQQAVGGLSTLEELIENHTMLITALEAEIENLELEIAEKQEMISGNCPAGYAIREVLADGSVACEPVGGGGGGVGAPTIVRAFQAQNVFVGQTVSLIASCPAGFFPTGGGHSNAFEGVAVVNSRSFLETGWEVRFFNGSTLNRLLAAYVHCVSFED